MDELVTFIENRFTQNVKMIITIIENEEIKKVFPTCRKVLIGRSLKKLRLKEYKNVLVVGAGRDPYRTYFSDNINYIRSDIAEVPGLTDVVCDAQELTFDNCSFNCVFATELFEHLKLPGQFISESHRVLKEHGVLIFTCPFLFHIHGDPSDYWRPTENILFDLTKDFTKVKIIQQGNRVCVISDLLTTSFKRIKILLPFRIFNHIIARLPKLFDSTAPSGYIVIAVK